jgi:hypothetical protein
LSSDLQQALLVGAECTEKRKQLCGNVAGFMAELLYELDSGASFLPRSITRSMNPSNPVYIFNDNCSPCTCWLGRAWQSLAELHQQQTLTRSETIQTNKIGNLFCAGFMAKLLCELDSGASCLPPGSEAFACMLSDTLLVCCSPNMKKLINKTRIESQAKDNKETKDERSD